MSEQPAHEGGRDEAAPATSPEVPATADEADSEPSEADARRLADALGRGLDECFAALLECGGRAEDAATRLLEETGTGKSSGSAAATCTDTSREGVVSSTMAEVMSLEAGGDGYGDVEPETDQVFEDEAARLAEFTGQELLTCKAALQSHGGSADAAAAHLLSLLAEDDMPIADKEPVDQTESVQEDGYEAEQKEESRPGQPQQSEPAEGTTTAVDAARLAEATGKPLSLCLAALHAADGRADRAAAQLLFLDAEDGDVPDAAEDGYDSAADEEGKTSEPGVQAAEDDVETQPWNPDGLFSAEGGDPFVGVDAADVGADLLASHLQGASDPCDEESTAKRRRTE
eukprot:TRINITY_DN89735_c0_g1_i1.p1 TRINITY_DN89735_c0_g1~~TRINITY_DN89735_c0_g1_i1.p1  ORF type:complete len:354 (-),score=103.36 TRINITY_DN89735_c0_g1_i1:30-1061(-)